MNTAIITLTLAMTPTAAPFDVADAEVVAQDNASHLVTYDAEGDVSASVVIWAEPSGRLHLDADFADGRYLSATINGARADIDSDDSAEVAARLNAIDDFLANNPPQEGWLECGAASIATAASCAVGSIVGCVTGAVFVGVEVECP